MWHVLLTDFHNDRLIKIVTTYNQVLKVEISECDELNHHEHSYGIYFT